MTTSAYPTTTAGLRSNGRDLDLSETTLAELRDSGDLLGNGPALKERLQDEGYLLIRQFFDPEIVLAARRSILSKFQKDGLLEPGTDVMDGVLRSDKANGNFRPDMIKHDDAVDRVVFGPEIREFYQTLLGGAIRPFDYKWLRTVKPGNGTPPHCDVVYMGRGTWDLFTAWIPYGHVDYRLGGLMLSEDSHKQNERLKKYWAMDVDEYCENRPRGQEVKAGKRFWQREGGGFLSKDPVTLREKLGGRWLVGEFAPGDLLTFGMGMVHASLDNRTKNRVRISTDTRYQRADDPIDDRWIGENPTGHSLAGKRGRIC